MASAWRGPVSGEPYSRTEIKRVEAKVSLDGAPLRSGEVLLLTQGGTSGTRTVINATARGVIARDAVRAQVSAAVRLDITRARDEGWPTITCGGALTTMEDADPTACYVTVSVDGKDIARLATGLSDTA